jgi:hypothetical protein
MPQKTELFFYPEDQDTRLNTGLIITSCQNSEDHDLNMHAYYDLKFRNLKHSRSYVDLH